LSYPNINVRTYDFVPVSRVKDVISMLLIYIILFHFRIIHMHSINIPVSGFASCLQPLHVY